MHQFVSWMSFFVCLFSLVNWTVLFVYLPLHSTQQHLPSPTTTHSWFSLPLMPTVLFMPISLGVSLLTPLHTAVHVVASLPSCPISNYHYPMWCSDPIHPIVISMSSFYNRSVGVYDFKRLQLSGVCVKHGLLPRVAPTFPLSPCYLSLYGF